MERSQASGLAPETGGVVDRWGHPYLCLVLAVFCIAGGVSHPHYAQHGPAYLERGTRLAGYSPDSPSWEMVAYYFGTHLLGQSPRPGWPQAPSLQELPRMRLLRPVYPALGAVGLALWPDEGVFSAISIISYVVSALLIYAIGRLLGLGRMDSFVASAIFAVGTTSLKISVQAMADSTCLAFFLFALCVFLTLRKGLGKVLPRTAVAAALLLALLASPMSVALLPIFLLLDRRDPRRLRGAAVASGAALALYLAFCFSIDYSPFAQWKVAKPSTILWHHLDPDISTTRFYTLALGRTVKDVTGFLLRPYGLILVLAAVGVGYGRRRNDDMARVVTSWFALSLLLLFLWSMQYAGLYHDRFFLYCIPALGLAAVAGLRVFWERIGESPWGGRGPLYAAALLIGISPHFHPWLVFARRPLWLWVLAGLSLPIALVIQRRPGDELGRARDPSRGE